MFSYVYLYIYIYIYIYTLYNSPSCAVRASSRARSRTPPAIDRYTG